MCCCSEFCGSFARAPTLSRGDGTCGNTRGMGGAWGIGVSDTWCDGVCVRDGVCGAWGNSMRNVWCVCGVWCSGVCDALCNGARASGNGLSAESRDALGSCVSDALRNGA
mmetsp:Transcript_82547/g.120956  ORF Transcript_82547/g.120956 Transcript_82547/m.120956 type:complete len:110 (-) Transcript_82547:160-489(-)